MVQGYWPGSVNSPLAHRASSARIFDLTPIRIHPSRASLPGSPEFHLVLF